MNCKGDDYLNLYHGSSVVVRNPQIRPNLRALDFGAGFYLTSSKKQAVKWAKVVVKRRKRGKPTLNIYKFQEEELQNIKVLRFDKADGDWLDFVVKNRKEIPVEEEYDLVIGPVANDATLPVIDDYIDGVYTKEEAVKRLLPQNLTDQYAFLTTDALKYLAFEGKEIV